MVRDMVPESEMKELTSVKGFWSKHRKDFVGNTFRIPQGNKSSKPGEYKILEVGEGVKKVNLYKCQYEKDIVWLDIGFVLNIIKKKSEDK